MVRFAQTVHLSRTNTNTISKQTKTGVDMNHVTWEFNRGHPKWLPRLWYTRRKLCTYLASRLALSPNGPKQASTWASSPRSTIGSTPKWLWSLWYVWCKPCTNLVLTLTPSPNWPKQDLTWPTSLGVPLGAFKTFSKPWYVQRKWCTYLASRLGQSPNESKQASSWASSPWSTIRCV
jgi:hypothetical protein